VRLLTRLLARFGIPAFFFFSWILELLWNGILFDQLRLVPTRLTYWEAAGIWFAVSLLSVSVAIGSRSTHALRQPPSWRRSSEDLERSIEDVLPTRERVRDDLGDRIERSIQRRLARWTDADEETGWPDLGAMIERKVKRAFRAWID